MNKTVSILGATGSIGTQALEVIKKTGFRLYGITGHKNIQRLETLARRYRPAVVVASDPDSYGALKLALMDTGIRLLAGDEALCELAAADENDMVLNALVGMVGLRPTLAAIGAGRTVLLANKETLVVGGEMVMALAREKGVPIIPVDSEHSAIFQCLQGAAGQRVKSLLLTASGGPFFGKSREALREVTVEEALAHPSWRMGAKITIDSATMMNKGFELIEAVHLFDVTPQQVQIVIHRESVIHSLVEFEDNACLAQLSPPDMKLPIQYALTYPDRVACEVERLTLARIGRMTFYEPDYETFGCVNLCRKAILARGTAPAVLNGANEEAVALFLQGRISFLQIEELVRGACAEIKDRGGTALSDLLLADMQARAYVRSHL